VPLPPLGVDAVPPGAGLIPFDVFKLKIPPVLLTVLEFSVEVTLMVKVLVLLIEIGFELAS
jgi:hypothetical protein